MFSLGERLKTLREERKLTQAELAKALDIKNQSVVAYWETDRNKPPIDRLVQLCDFFDVSADYFLGRSERTTILSKEEDKLISMVRSLDARGKRTVYNIAKSEYETIREIGASVEYDGVSIDDSITESIKHVQTENFFPTINKSHPEYAEMREKTKELLALRREVGASAEGITRFLWMLGYGSRVRLIDVTGILRGLKTPHPIVYKHIKAYLTKDFTVKIKEHKDGDANNG